MPHVRVIAYRVIHHVLDLCIFVLAFTLGYFSFLLERFDTVSLDNFFTYDWRSLLWLLLIFTYSNVATLTYSGIYRSTLSSSFYECARTYLRSTLVALALVSLIGFFFRFLGTSRVWLLSATGYAFLLLLMKESILRSTLIKLRGRLSFQRRSVIVGKSPDVIASIHKSCTKDMLLGLKIIGNISPSELINDESKGDSVPYCGSLDNLPKLLNTLYLDVVVIVGADLDHKQLEYVLGVCEERGLDTLLHFELLKRPVYTPRISEKGGLSFVHFSSVPQDGISLFIKSVIDRGLALILLILLSPLLLAVAIAIKLTSRGPVFFSQNRAGINGKVFSCHKFRSMKMDAEQERQALLKESDNSGPAFKMARDPRITSFGKAIRKTSIDELPQLLNVVRGEMSLVGPRPLPIEEVREFSSWHRRRLSMRPGITGLWQVEGRSNIKDFNNWMELDLEYIDSWSLSLDLIILIRTIPAVLFMRGAR